MALPLPNLDDRTYAELVAEAIARIPTECPEWTDHNPSDTGIILIELLAWLTEMTLYQVNQIPDRNLASFLSLLKGEAWTLDADLPADQRQTRLNAEIQATLTQLKRRYRAITPEDFAGLILDDWPAWAQTMAQQGKDLVAEEIASLVAASWLFGVPPMANMAKVETLRKQVEALQAAIKAELPEELKPEATPESLETALANPVQIDRVLCLPQQKPAAPATDNPTTAAPGHITLVVVPQQGELTPLAQACLKVFLDQRRLLTTQLHLVLYRPKPITLGANLVLTDGAVPETVKDQAIAAFQQFCQPTKNPQNPHWQGQGWPFGRSVYRSELYQLLDGLPGVDYVDLLEFRDAANQPLSDRSEIALDVDQLAAIALTPDDVVINLEQNTIAINPRAA